MPLTFKNDLKTENVKKMQNRKRILMIKSHFMFEKVYTLSYKKKCKIETVCI